MRFTLCRRDGGWHYSAAYKGRTLEGQAMTRDGAKAARMMAMYALVGS